MKPLFSQKFAILTAENPRYGSVEGGNAALEQEMKDKNLKFTPMKGKYGVPENSYLVENPDHQDILSWGKKYGQDSVIVSDGGLHKMVYTNGPHEGLWHEGHSISIHEKEPEDFYSTINLNNKPTHFTIDFDVNKKHGEQFKKSDSPKHLIHFSTTPNLTTLDPEFQGTAGRHSPETKHGKPTHPRVYFYEEGTPTESVVTGGAKSKYIVKHPGDDKIIDIAKDTEGLQQQAKEQWLQKPIGSMQDAYFKLLKDKGYLGFKNSASGLPNVVGLFHATPIHAEVPMPTDMNTDWTKAEVPMSLKKSDVKEAVEKIKGPAKVNEVLDAAKPDMRSKILSALRKEKLAKMNGTGVPGTGGATPPAMRPPVPAAPASMAMSKADESESRMAKKDLKDIMEYAQALDNMVAGSEDLEDWVDSKITVARQYLSDIAHYLSYEHGQPTEELDKGDVVSMKDKKVISTDTKAAPKALVTKQPTQAVYKRGAELAIDSGFRGAAGKTGGKPDLSLAKSKDLEKGDVVGIKDKKVISTDVKPASKELVAQQPKAAKNERALAQRVKSNWEGPRPELAKSDSKKAKFERCVLAVKKKSSDKVNPYAVCHSSVGDAKKSEDLEKADMKVKEQKKPTKGMPQAKQLKADADLEKIKEGAENVAKAADKKKSELNKSGYFKEDKKTQLPKWHDPLKEQRESAAQEEQELRPDEKMHIWAELEHHKQMTDKLKKPKEELEKKFSIKGTLAAGALGAASLAGGAHASPESDLHSKLSNLNVMGEYHTPKGGSQAILKEPTQLKANPTHPQASYMSESKDKTISGRFHGPDAEKAKKLLTDYESVGKSEELEKGKNVREQREAVFGGWKTSANSPRRKKQIAALSDMIKRRFGLEAQRAPGKTAASGKTIDKPSFHDNVVEHIGNPDSLAHEVGHLYQYGKDMESIDPRKEFKTKEQSLGDWQKDMDSHWGDLNVKHGYKKQAQTAEEYEPMALENYYRRRAGLPTHQKTASTEEENRIESEKKGKKYNQPKISRTQAVDDPSKEIVQKVKVKGKDGKEKEVWLTGSTKNLTAKTRELVDQIDRGELVLDPSRGYVEGTSVDAKINRRARVASKDPSRKDADTLMRSDEVLEKKLILGEGKPSKVTKKATPEEHKAIMDRLSTALDTVKVDTSPEAVKERKMLLEHVKHKLKGTK